MRCSVNLVPESVQLRQVFRRRAAQWTVVLSMAAVAAGAWLYLVDYRGYLDQRVALEAQELEYGKVKRIEAEISQAERQRQEIQRREQFLRNRADNSLPLALLGALSRAAADAHSDICVSELAYDVTPAASDKSGGAADRGKSLIVLKGIGGDPVGIARFATNLRQCGLFREVALKSTEVREPAVPSVLNYLIECKVLP